MYLNMRNFFFLLTIVPLTYAKPQGYGVVNAAINVAKEDPNLINDIFKGSGGKGFRDSGLNENNSSIEPEPHYGDGGSHVNEVVDTSSEECAYYADQEYKCVPYYTCEDGEIVTDGGGLIDIRSSFAAVLDPASSKCPGYLEVCCRHPNFSTNAPVVTQTTTPEPVTQPPKPRAYKPECGRRNIGGVGVRIQNDKFKGSTQFGEWPHMCAVLEIQAVAYGEDINKYVCGASLIAPGVVLTGAHCVFNTLKESIKIRCGEWDSQNEVEPMIHQDREIKDIRIHPQFDSKNIKNDFALLFMEEDFELAPHVDTICLPDNLAGINSYDQIDCFATGWGKDKFGKLGEYQVIMKQVNMDMVNSSECERRLRRTRLGEDFELDKSFVCAGGEKDKDTCKGDGGGPLVCPLHREGNTNGYGVVQEPIYVQAGIIAWGIDCGLEGNPGVYANVADGLCFIDWATQCQTGIPQYFNITGCENWGVKKIIDIKLTLQNYNKKLNTIALDDTGSPSNIRNLYKRIHIAEKSLKMFEDQDSICIASTGYLENNINSNFLKKKTYLRQLLNPILLRKSFSQLNIEVFKIIWLISFNLFIIYLFVVINSYISVIKKLVFFTILNIPNYNNLITALVYFLTQLRTTILLSKFNNEIYLEYYYYSIL
ncbi:phenoloxidase-activating factor 2-like [Lepeophtheirus salmonis]|uniref:phenoloxidase-activating factor 2-like n=1 Tax=Lepeophtheirus salmonis TaxID=72036 RepID=UPI001AE75752|nr:phenoloxidase-activating factor 2-like [Lepeophtheirus salmonis]